MYIHQLYYSQSVGDETCKLKYAWQYKNLHRSVLLLMITFEYLHLVSLSKEVYLNQILNCICMS